MCNFVGLPAGTLPREHILKPMLLEGLQQIDTVLTAHSQDLNPVTIEFEIAEGATEHTF